METKAYMYVLDKSSAMSAEALFKQKTRQEKLAYIETQKNAQH